MKRIASFLSAFLVLFCFKALAQDYNDYKPLESQGYIPADFLLLMSEKAQAERETRIAQDEKKATRRSKEEFILGSSFMMNRMLSSGRVLFNDPVSDYLNQIMANILEQEPELQGKVRVYAVKSSSVNAFATNDGIIMVNLGLIAQLETEAQLAFILCHELVHYKKEHNINVFLENVDIEKGRGAYRGTTLSEKLISSSNYSKEVETEADMEGLELFLKTRYSTNSIGGVFDVLHYAYLPFDDIEFDKSFFESDYMVFPKEYFLDEVASFSPFEEEDDSRSSHPSTYKRRLTLTTKLEDNGKGKGTEEYLLSREKFENIRKICRYELSNLYFNNDDYEMAIYNSYMLLKENPESKYLRKTISKSLYCIAKYSNNDDFYSIHTRYKKTEGSSQQLYHLLEKMSSKERTILALRYAYKTSIDFNDDKDLKRIVKDLLKDLAENHYQEGFFREKITDEEKVDLRSMRAIMNGDTAAAEMIKEEATTRKEADETEKTEEKEEKPLSKYDKIRKQRKEDIKEGKAADTELLRFALVDLFADVEFKEAFEKALAENKEDSEEDKRAKEKSDLKKLKKINKHGYALGADKAVIVNPFFMKLDLRYGENVRYEQTEAAMLRYYDKIDVSATSMGLQTEMLATTKFNSSSIENFNDLAFLTKWVDSRFSQIDQDIVDMESEQLKELMEKYGTKYFCWTGVLNFRTKKNAFTATNICFGIIFPPYLPFVIAKMVSPQYETFYYYVAFDFETGEPAMFIYNQFKQGDAQDYINVNIYDSLYQLKSSRK